eukprot:CAMPEP_0118952366 /NCGR_PEP_ID=MMETSP1169-20130426/54722_1 /TAXON_ID=36882 /ORGANISM="Pyramimonas obovata, Strain CCMP722" /LENGTH=116 /DNA_ID=CAMNT_0006899595 /DNA_START=189 /DNA_END=536 /DNA_ORIENTATION=-
MYQQTFVVPLKLNSPEARGAVELLLRLADGDPIQLIVAITEHLAKRYRTRFPSARKLLKSIMQRIPCEMKALQEQKRRNDDSETKRQLREQLTCVDSYEVQSCVSFTSIHATELRT